MVATMTKKERDEEEIIQQREPSGSVVREPSGSFVKKDALLGAQIDTGNNSRGKSTGTAAATPQCYTNLSQVPHPAHCHRTFTPAEFEQFTFGMSTRGIDTRPCSFPGCVALASKGLQLAMCVFAAMRMKISDISYRIMHPVATSYCCFQHNSATIGNRIT